MNRKQKAITLLNNHAEILQCPYCHQSLKVEEEKSLKCEKNHTFDVAKQGYINLVTNGIKTAYDKTLFASRYEIISSIGLYDELQKELVASITKEIKKEGITIIDLGCGEGSHLNQLKERLADKNITGIGIDISKDAILAASKHYDSFTWLVGDLANLPIQNNSVDIILDILSPSNYKEFLRILAKEGLVLKVVPASDYLKEIREVIYDDPKKHRYIQEENIMQLFYQHFNNVKETRITYTKQLSPSEMEHLIKMTPLTWNAKEEKLTKILTTNPFVITIDLIVLVGKNK